MGYLPQHDYPTLSLPLFFFFSSLFLKLEGIEMEEGTALPSAGLLRSGSQWPGLSPMKARSQELRLNFSLWVQGPKLWAVFCCSPSP